mgnify:CR=1 FL=1
MAGGSGLSDRVRLPDRLRRSADPIDAGEAPVLLFFSDFERDKLFRHDRYLQRVVRPMLAKVGVTGRVSGFQMWFRLLAHALTLRGETVIINDRSLARRHPDWPVGLVGYPHLLDDWNLPNPAVLGPAMLNHPAEDPDLMTDPRFRHYLVTCSWMHDLFRPAFGEGVESWFAGIDVDLWPSPPDRERSIDVLIYDKIRWNRDTLTPVLLDAAVQKVRSAGLSFRIVTYGAYDHGEYQQLLARARSMIFLCEHETQGMAYQEAMASGVPILAWDNGTWLDPDADHFSDEPIPASSVPHFSDECGERFRTPDDLDEAFDRFWERRADYRPREFVRDHLSVSQSADRYMALYQALQPV